MKMRTIDHRRFKDELYAELGRIGSAVASPRRLEILDLLAQRERTVEDLANEIGLSVANASRHLRVLAAARLVAVRRSGTFAHYRVANRSVLKLLRALGEAAEASLPEVQATLRKHLGPRSLETLDPAAIVRRVEDDEVVLLDVRPEEEYRAGHIPGARMLPLEMLRQKRVVSTLPRDRELIVYCRGPYCVWADEAVELLRRHGFKARRLLLGAPDWTALGEELETAAS
jgi:rhodanese-related sulfurtransferase/DNA-binding transcriptional ArsR family regulator